MNSSLPTTDRAADVCDQRRPSSTGPNSASPPGGSSGVFGAVLLILVVLLNSSASACNIPVFRYALERWKSDAYEIIVFHDQRLSVAENVFVKMIEASSAENSGTANVNLVLSAVDSPTKATHAELWKTIQAEGKAKLPYLVIRTKLREQTINCWHGSLDEAMDAALLESPARAEIAKRLLGGDAVVWLLLKSNDENRTTAARDLLHGSFSKLSTNLSLPDGVGLPGSELFSEVPLLLQFSVLEIDREDKNEQFLVKLLSGIQQQAFDDGEPLIVPVFGRGRALEVIAAAELNQRLVEDLTVFLSGPCSCQVKNRNPGFDLLLSTNWDVELFGDEGERPPAASVRDSSDRPNLLTIPPGRNR